MIAQIIGSVWRENLEAAERAWHRLAADAGESGGRNGGLLHGRSHRRMLAGLVAALAVLALTYSAASALVSGAASSSAARNDYALVLQAASAKYRLSRAECMGQTPERRDACIAEAHANETRARNVASLAPRKQLAALRSQSANVLVSAEAQDSIVIEPACNVVARGNASVCEIQVKGSVIEAANGVSVPRFSQADKRDDARSGAMISLAQWLQGSRSERDHYNVVAVVAP